MWLDRILTPPTWTKEGLAINWTLGREDFSGIDNEALDFSELENYLNNEGDKTNNYFQSELLPNELNKASDFPAKSNRNRFSNNFDDNPPLIHIGTAITETAVPVSRLNGSLHKGIQNINVNLPESPPDSGSEPSLSPLHADAPLHGTKDTMMQASGDMKYLGYGNVQPMKHLADTLTPPLQLPGQPQSVQTSLPQHSLASVPSQSASVGSMLSHLQQHPIASSLGPGLAMQQQNLGPPTPHILYDSNDDFLCDSLDSAPNNHKKRKLTENHKNVVNNNLLNGMMNVKQEAGGISPEPHANTPALSATDDDYSFDFSGPDGSGMFLDSAYQCIRFQPFQQNTWAILCDHTLKELPPPNYRVDADKGFNFSNADDSFVCQKKNHFQVTVHIQPMGEPHYVKTADGVKKIDHFYLHFNGVKVESPNQTIKVEQSQSDRSKRPFHPVPLDLSQEQVSKTTVGRLHFSETTSNNMRKKGKPNPDQRYFYLVVSLCVASGDLNYTVIAHASERIIVRASNPGQFENDMELSWQRGQLADSIYHAGRVGINTDRPDEALVIHGNMKVTGHIVQPSDARAKTNVEEVDTKEQLKNVANMRIVRYKYLPEFAKHVGLGEGNPTSTGVIAQEVQNLIPDAVQGAGDITLPDGQQIENFLVVNKDRIFMENIGAVKELCKVTDNLGTRIDELEKVNKKLTSQKVKRLDSLKSTSSRSTVTSHACSVSSSKKFPRGHCQYRKTTQHESSSEDSLICNNSYVQFIIIILVLIMAFCVVAMSAIYFFERGSRHVPTLATFLKEEDTNNLTSIQLTRHFPFLEPDKLKVNIENSIAVQETKKESRFLEPSRILPERKIPKMATPDPDTSVSMSISTHAYRTSVPILKPRTIGVRDDCRYPYFRQSDCIVMCCSATGNRPSPLLLSNEDIPHLNDKIEPPIHSMALSEPEVLEDSLERELLITPSNTVSHSPVTESVVTDKPTSAAQTKIGPDVEDAHQEHQNQLVPPNTSVHVPLRVKALSEKNITEDSGNENIDKIVLANQFEQKVKNLRVEVEKRSRRGLKPFTRKDLPKAIESLRLLELNTTIGQEYCNTLQCAHRTGPSFSYLIPISKYMREEYVTLQFNLGVPLIVDHCQPDGKPVACPVPQNGAGDLPHDYTREQNLTEEVDPNWRLPIGLYLKSTYRFRVQARTVVTDTPCSLPATELGHSFIEFILVFERNCNK
ncbi:hypothetical protein JTE90_027547 [Oedothorax gibbosus]|uniref:Myelin regulatory factor n=1 Tax=Oedothorax gibbosus TaxID=931172 RepID=A0AAV6VJP0_9ARAC|nr:hypothetical protein JTE90_027547 [Oedothorax gibbosus]